MTTIPEALKGKRVLHFSYQDIAGNAARYARNLRKAGIEADSAVYETSWLDHQNDFVLEDEPDRSAFYLEALDKYDIFHIHWPIVTMRANYADLAEIKRRGKKLFISFWGSDQRDSRAWIKYQQLRFLGHEPPKPHPITIQHTVMHQYINAWADMCYGLELNPWGLINYALVDMDEWPWSLRGEGLKRRDPEAVTFVHAPSRRSTKGTQIILDLWKDGRDRGIIPNNADLKLIEGLPHAQAKEEYAKADYAIDQIGVGTFGAFGAECMALGVPVLVYQNELFDRLWGRYMDGRPPVFRITSDSFAETIHHCCTPRSDGVFDTMPNLSRDWVEDFASHQTWIPRLISDYATVASGHRPDVGWTPGYFRAELELVCCLDAPPAERNHFWAWCIARGFAPEDTQYDKRVYE